jgi:hypothetical protein
LNSKETKKYVTAKTHRNQLRNLYSLQEILDLYNEGDEMDLSAAMGKIKLHTKFQSIKMKGGSYLGKLSICRRIILK